MKRKKPYVSFTESPAFAESWASDERLVHLGDSA